MLLSKASFPQTRLPLPIRPFDSSSSGSMAISIAVVDSATEGSVISSPVYDKSATLGSSLLRPKRLICPPSWQLRRLQTPFSSKARAVPSAARQPTRKFGRGSDRVLSTCALRNVRAALLAASLVGVSCSPFRSPPPAPHVPNPAAWSKAELTIAYLGHASVLIDFGGTLLLTDPTLYDRVGVALCPI